MERKPKMSELLFAAANAANPYSAQQQQINPHPSFWTGNIPQDYEAGRQMERIFRVLAIVYKTYEDANDGTPDSI